MTTLYKMNNSGTISWWEIEEVREPLADSIADQFDNQNYIPRLGYNTWWGNDHNHQTRLTDNHQYTTAANRPTMSVAEQIQAQIDEMIARKGYSREVPNSPPELPMLAQTWADFIDKCNSTQSSVEHWESAYVQPKLDGIRCIATPLTLYSRRNKEFTAIPHIEIVMNVFLSHPSIPSTIKLDGELYIQGADLQTIQGTVSRLAPDPFLYRSVEYHVFDVVDTTATTQQRQQTLLDLEAALQELWKDFSPPEGLERHKVKNCPIKIVPTQFIPHSTDSKPFNDELQKYNTEYRNAGYEGTIIRNPSSLYQPNYRTYDLIKYKEFADAEFLITQVLPAKNDMGVFLCKTLNGKTFKCSPAWTHERRRQILRYPDNYIGRQLTVKYERLSAEGIPLKPIGMLLRND